MGSYMNYMLCPAILVKTRVCGISQSHGLKNLPLVDHILYLPEWNGHKLSLQRFHESFCCASITHDWLMVAKLNTIDTL